MLATEMGDDVGREDGGTQNFYNLESDLAFFVDLRFLHKGKEPRFTFAPSQATRQ